MQRNLQKLQRIFFFFLRNTLFFLSLFSQKISLPKTQTMLMCLLIFLPVKNLSEKTDKSLNLFCAECTLFDRIFCQTRTSSKTKSISCPLKSTSFFGEAIFMFFLKKQPAKKPNQSYYQMFHAYIFLL